MSAATAERGAYSVVAPLAPQDLYRILLLRKSGSELLVAGGRPPLTLPCVEIPKWERIAENMNAAVRERYGISPVCLFTPDPSVCTTGSEQPLYQVMETRKVNVAAPEGTYWLPVNSFRDQFFADAQDSRALTSALRQVHEFENGEMAGPFGKPGWIEELSSWIQHAIDLHGLRLTGEFRQLNASPTFALLRFETNGPAVWFKAVGEPNLREFPISVALSRLLPGFVPSVVATHPAWRGWLATESAGSTLEEVSHACAWDRAAQTLGALQIASIRKTDQLLEAGCRDLRVTFLLTLVDPYMEAMSHLMEQQQKTPPPILDRDELMALGSQMKEALSELAGLGVPDTLGHLDFNPGNIVCSAEQCIFIDWAEAYVGPPFLTFQYLLEHLRQTSAQPVVSSQHLADQYDAIWLCFMPPSAVTAAQKMAPLVAAFACAVVSEWNEASHFRGDGFAGYLRSLTRRMQREAGVLRAARKYFRVGVIQ